jgi:hypothetical protein
MYKLIIIPIAVMLVSLGSCSEDKLTIINSSSISIEEESDLKFSREEEKLARDVYLFSYEKYGNVIFNNIAKSEQQHMDQILMLLNNYQIKDPASSQIGVFTDQDLQKLYNELTAKSNISIIDALEVGAIIEDLDINDLKILASRTDKFEILNVYEKLQCGSRNHLRSYINQLDLNNIEYFPEYISTEDFNDIISQTNEQCVRVTL